jgi:hypothetical protein
MTRRHIEMELGHAGVEYVMERLSLGKQLSRRVLARVAGARPTGAYTFLPPGTSPEAALQFEYGGKLPPVPVPGGEEYRRLPDGSLARFVRVPNTDDALVGRIEAHLASDVFNICLFEDAVGSRSDPATERLRSPTWFEGEDVYHAVPSGSAELDIYRAIRSAKSWLTAGFLTSIPSGLVIEGHRATLSAEHVRHMANHTKKVIVGAYDGEGYVFCPIPE